MMLRKVHKMGIGLMLAVYLVGTVGFGVHHCIRDNSYQVVWLGGPVCHHAHHAHPTHPAHSAPSCAGCTQDGEEAHNSDCCATQVHCLEATCLASHHAQTFFAPPCLGVLPELAHASLCPSLWHAQAFHAMAPPLIDPLQAHGAPLRL